MIFPVVKQLQQLQRKPRKTFWGFNRILIHGLHDTSAMLYQLIDGAASLESGQVRVQFIPVIWREWGDVHINHIYEQWIKNRSESDLCSCEAVKKNKNKNKKQKKIWGSNRIWIYDLRGTSAMLYQLSCIVWSFVGSRSRASSIYTSCMQRVRWCAYELNHKYELWIKNRSESDLHSCEATYFFT